MTTYLVRHGSAGHRDQGDPADDGRILDEPGKVQAEKLADWLRHLPITRIVSSPFPRCVQTVEPLGAALGLTVETRGELAESTPIEQSWPLLEELAWTTAVVCSHGDVIPDLIRRAQLRGLHIPGKSGCSKGSVWTLEHWDGARFATGVYTPVTA